MNNDLKNLVPAQVIALARFASLALGIINARLLMLIALGANIGLFAWVMAEPHWIRFAGACAFAVLVGWPVCMMERARTRVAQSTQGDGNGE